MIEYVLLLPLLLMLALPVTDYARAILAHLTLTGHARAVANWVSFETPGQDLQLRLNQAVADLALEPMDAACFIVIRLDGGCGGKTCPISDIVWQIIPQETDCPQDLPHRIKLAGDSLPGLGAGETAYLVEAFGRVVPIFLRGVLGVAAPSNDVYARAVFTARRQHETASAPAS